MNLARADHYTEASYLVSDICRQLLEQGADSTQIGSLLVLSEQYNIYADNAPVCRQLHSDGIYTVPMGMFTMNLKDMYLHAVPNPYTGERMIYIFSCKTDRQYIS